MKILVLLGLYSCIFSINAFSVTSIQSAKSKCDLPKDSKILIGCTTTCGKFNTWSLMWQAKKLGYEISLINLYSEKQTIDYTQVDGILIPGGADINPDRYLNTVDSKMKKSLEQFKHLARLTSIGDKRDDFEFNLLKKYFKNKDSKHRPILGICRGMQVLGVSQGIPMYIDIKNELEIENRSYTLDTIEITKPNSLMEELIGDTQFKGVELHHQALHIPYFEANKEKWPNLGITSVSNNSRIAESLEFFDRPILGVQFHPEYTFGRVNRVIFKWLLKKSCMYKNIIQGKGKL